MDKDKLIKSEISKYKKMFKDIAPDKKNFAEKLYKRAAFMSATLDEMEEQVNSDGPVVTGVNGNGFEVTSEHPAQKSYNTMIKNYNSTIKLLIELLPEDDKEDEDELIKYLTVKRSGGLK